MTLSKSLSFCFVLSLLFVLTACTEDSSTESKDSAKVGLSDLGEKTAPSGDTAKSDLEKQSEAVQATAKTELGALKTSAAKTQESTQTQLSGGEVGMMTDRLLELAGAGTTVQKLKGVIGDFDSKQVLELGKLLTGAIQKNESAIEELKGKLGSLTTGLLGGESKDLKSSLEKMTGELTVLKEKLLAVVDNLKAKGVDVSQFTSFLK